MLTFSALAFFGSPPLNLGLTYGRLRGDSPNFLGVVRCLFRGGPPKKCQGAKSQHGRSFLPNDNRDSLPRRPQTLFVLSFPKLHTDFLTNPGIQISRGKFCPPQCVYS